MKMTIKAPLVFIAGPPRCGTQVTWNITRDILALKYQHVLPKEHPYKDIWEHFQANFKSNVPDTAYCYKAHVGVMGIDPSYPVKIITNCRDLYDMALSYKYFMKAPIEEVIKRLPDWVKGWEICTRISDLVIEFEDLKNHLDEVVLTIAGELEVPATLPECDQIAERWSKKNVKRIIDNIDNPNPPPIMNLDGSRRRMDPYTLFQDNHIGPEHKEDDEEIREAVNRLQETIE